MNLVSPGARWAALLTGIGRTLGFDAATAQWWREHGARLVDALLISSMGILLLLVVVAVWRGHRWLPGGASRAFDRRLVLVLVGLLFGGSALAFTLLVLPNRVSNMRRLQAVVATLPGPIYTDQFTAGELAYLRGYTANNVFSAGPLGTATLTAVLAAGKGCLLIHEPELDQLQQDGLPVSPLARGLLDEAPHGWRFVERFPSLENPLEHVALLCAQGQTPALGATQLPRHARPRA